MKTRDTATQAEKRRITTYFQVDVFRRLRMTCAMADEPMSTYVERAVAAMLDREAGK